MSAERKRGRPAAAKCVLCSRKPKEGNADGLCELHEEILNHILEHEKLRRQGKGSESPLPVKRDAKPQRSRSRRTVPEAARRKVA